MAEAAPSFGRYEIRGELGKGGFAMVYRAWDRRLAREVALKALLPFLAAEPTVRQRFLGEAQAIARLHHPNIITVHDVDEADGRPYFTMELINGPTLGGLIAGGRGLPLAQVSELTRSLASAIDYLHSRRLVHRDIKASNVMLDQRERVVLMDFGVARALDHTQLTQSGISIGTPEAMSPEQVRGTTVGPPADIYALGVLVYRLLAGRAPFVGDTVYVLHAHAYEPPPALSGFRPDLPRSVYAAIEAALAKDPAERPPSAAQFADALAAGLMPPAQREQTAQFVRLPLRPPATPPGQPPGVEPQLPPVQEAAAPPPAATDAGVASPGLGEVEPGPPAAVSVVAPPDDTEQRAVPAAAAVAPPAPRVAPVPTRPLGSPGGGARGRRVVIGAIVAAVIVVAAVVAFLVAGRGGSGSRPATNGSGVAGTTLPPATAVTASSTAGGVATQASVAPSAVAATVTRAPTRTAAPATVGTALPSATAGTPVSPVASAAVPSASPVAPATGGTVATLAGSGKAGFADGAADQAQFDGPKGVAVDGAGSVIVADSGNNRVRRVEAGGSVSTVAGPKGAQTASNGLVDGPGDAARFNDPRGIAVDKQGNVYVADSLNHRLRRIAPDGRVSIFGGNQNTQAGDTGLGGGGLADGPAASARFNQPTGIAIGVDGTLYVADTGNNRIRKVAPDGTVTTLAGAGGAGSQGGGFADGPGSAARFNAPSAVAVDATGNVFVADTDNSLIRKVAPDGTVTTYAGRVSGGAGVRGAEDGPRLSASFAFPSGIAVDAEGTVYVAESSNHRIRVIAPNGTVSTLAGGKEGYADGAGTDARFDFPSGLAVGGNTLYVADSQNNRIRAVSLK